MSDYLRSPVAAQANVVSKAQQFEDEKRRIMASCFSRQDADGSLLESYITHCRVTEDGLSSEPPAPGASQEGRKARVIMVAVRKSGRVRMHKGRENPNGSFSIGKTWNLDDLQSITNYGAPNEKGFTITILKPYYWQAGSAKEKDFFISSLLKIYKKYTGGKIPEMIAFSKAELDALLGPGGSAALQQQQQQQRRDDDGRAPRTPTTPASTGASLLSSSASSSVPQPSTRNLSSAQSQESLNKPRQYHGQRTVETKPLAQSSSNAMRPAKSSDTLSGRRTPSDNPPSRQTPSSIPPIVTTIRHPSNSSTRSGQSRAPSRGPAPSEDDRSTRQAPSREGFNRSPSLNSQLSQESRREAIEQYPYTGKPQTLTPASTPTPTPTPPPPPPPLQPPQESKPAPKKKSTRDIASQFRLAAHAYGVGNQLARPRTRPKTPTTPTYSSPTYTSVLSREPTGVPPAEAPPAVPQIKYPSKPGGDQANGNGAAYGLRPSGDERRPRSPSKEQQQPLSPAEIPPLVPKEPPPRSEARGRPAVSRQGSQSSLAPSTPTGSRAPPVINEPALMIKKPTMPSSTPVVSPPQGEASLEPPIQSGRQSPLAEGTTALLAPRDQPRSRSRSPGGKSRRRSSNVSILDGIDKSRMTVDIEQLLREFNWDSHGKLDQLKAEVRQELSRVESSNVVINVDGDDRIEQLSAILDLAIKECEDMDGLLTLYAVELTSLNDDITHIENQSQGLQLQTANQKTLQKELQTLLDTISISPAQMDVLKQGSLESPRGLEQIEQTLSSLYKAMKTIEPSSAHDTSSPRVGRRNSLSDEGVGGMRALQERKEDYRNGCRAFLGRLRQFLNIKFQAEIMEIKKDATIAQVNTGLRPRMIGHEKAYQNLWKFAGLIAFARDVDGDEYVELRKLYEKPVKQVIQEEIREHISAWKRITKKSSLEEQELFTAPEKEELVSQGLSAARKLTVKKSIARIRTGGGSFASSERPTPGIVTSHEAFSGAFSEIYQLVFKEQNFIVGFFHLSSRNSADFVDFVNAGTPESRRLGDVSGLRAVEPDKLKAKLIYEYMCEIFSFLLQDLQNMVEWATQGDATQGVGIMYAVEQRMATLDETDQEFLLRTLQKLHDRLAGLFSKFLDEQVKAIEETKVKIKKRKGVIQFMRVFPGFAAKVEEQIPYDRTSTDADELDVREMVNDGYKRINKAMFESLQTIAKDSPSASQSVDPEDKEQLNYHITMIENMHHYLEEVEARDNPILGDFRRRAEEELKEHMALYVGAVIRRPLAKLLDFIENVEMLVKTGTDDIAGRSSHNKTAFRKVLEHHAESKDIRKGIEQLKKRVDKHFGDGDDATLSQRLVDKTLSRLEDEYINVHKRIMLLLVGPYKDCGLECQFMVNDVKVAFKK